ncbi:MAG: hypothetical protein Q8J78_14460 [Moraxellaceae bacterium]|nr:hypothetical protein [Moraxellaceae bacterium]
MRMLILLASLLMTAAVSAEPAGTQGAAPMVSTPKLVLAMDRILPGTTESKVKARLNEEVRAVVNLYLAGHVREWYFRQDRPGAVFILEVASLEEAEKLVESLPLSRAGLIAYDLVPLGPYVPLATLLGASKP